MKRVALIILLASMAGCRSSQPVVAERVETVRTVSILQDTVRIVLPAESAMEIVCDSVSHLETSCAVSDVRIGADGRLTHRLVNNREPLPMAVPRTVEHTETVRTERPTVDQAQKNSLPWAVIISLLLTAAFMVRFNGRRK